MSQAASSPEAKIPAVILEVSERRSGTSLSGNHALGATTLTLDSIYELPNSTGQLLINGTVYTYTATDLDLSTVTLSTGLTLAADDNDEVALWPLSYDKWALAQADPTDDAVPARVGHSLVPLIPLGIREETDRESCFISEVRGVWTVTDLIAVDAQMDGAYIAPWTLEPDAVTDGLPPSSSPTPAVVGGVGSLFVTWDAVANHDPVTYDLYVSATSGFSPGPSNFVGSTNATAMLVRSLTGGVALQYGTPYYVAIIARDIDGSAFVGGQGTGSPQQVTTPDVSASFVYAGTLLANQIIGGEVQAEVAITGKLMTARSGQRVEIDANGIHQYGPDGASVIIDLPNDPGQTSKFTGVINTSGIIVNDGLELRGQKNIFQTSSVTTLATNIGGSTLAPTLTAGWEGFDGTLKMAANDTINSLYSTHYNADSNDRYFMAEMLGGTDVGTGPIVIGGPGGIEYRYTLFTNSDGDVQSTIYSFGMTAINIGTGVRLVQYISKNQSPASLALRSMDPSSMTTAGTIAPTTKVEVAGPYSLTGKYSTQLGRCFSPVGSSTFQNRVAMVGVGYNGTLARYDMQLFLYDVSDSAITQVGSTLTIASPGGSANITGVAYGSSGKMGFQGTEQNLWVVAFNDWVYVLNTSGVRQTDLEFPVPTGTYAFSASGSVAAGSNAFAGFRSTTRNLPVGLSYIPTYKHTNITWASTDSSKWWAGYTWADTDAGGTGLHETNVSTLSSITMNKRQQLVVTVPTLPDPISGSGGARGVDDVNAFLLYMQRGAVAPTNAQLWKQSTQPAALAQTVTLTAMPVWSGTTNPPASTTFPAQIPAAIQSNAMGADGLPKIKLTGDGTSHFESLDVSGVGAAAFTGKAFDQLYYGIRAQARIFGGGTQAVTSAWEVSWSSRFMVISLGKAATLATDGYFEMIQPPAGTVIPGFGGSTGATVTASGVPLAQWEALYYQLPYGSVAATVNANYKIVRYTSDFKVPNDWVLLCVRQGDAGLIEFAGGSRVRPTTAYYMPDDWIAPTFQNSWSNYGLGGYVVAGYRRTTEGRVLLRGVVKSGTINLPIFTLPVGYRPINGHEIFLTGASGGIADLRVFATGAVQVSSYYAGGTNGSVSLSGVAFDVY